MFDAGAHPRKVREGEPNGYDKLEQMAPRLVEQNNKGVSFSRPDTNWTGDPSLVLQQSEKKVKRQR